MKSPYLLIGLALLTLLNACGNSKTMTQSQWENGSYEEKTMYSSEEVDEIIGIVLNAEQKDRPYQAPADKVWQLDHSDIEIELDCKEKILQGKATLTLKPYFYEQNTLTLDAKGMDIFSVELAQQQGHRVGPKPDPLIWSYTDSLHLSIQFPYVISPSEKVQITVSYQANPERKLTQLGDVTHTAVSDDKGVYFINTDGSNPIYPMQIWTQGEPESNSRWFPTLDHPNQKHTQRISLVYPDTLISISNGYLLESKKLGNGNKKDIWEMKAKHSVYLSMFAIGSWEVIHDTASNTAGATIPLRYFVEPAYKAYAKQIFGNTPEMIHFFSTITGIPYPWNKYDQIVCREFVSGAMENTTAVIHSEGLQDPTNDMEDYISHELFHHWFGDYATCESWSHLSMNESFATYSEYLWREHKYGATIAEEWLFDNTTFPYLNDEGLPSDELETTPLINPHFKHANNQFDDIRYNKGAQILHELRLLIGSNAFNKSMQLYLTRHAYENGNAYDWKKCIESVTGKNMDHFFNSWYFQGGEFSMGYATYIDSITQQSMLHLSPSVAENAAAVTGLKTYGQSKMQHVYIHVLGNNQRTWDTSVWIYPATVSMELSLPFPDSMVFITYSNPQIYNFSIDTDIQTLEKEEDQRPAFNLHVNRAHHAIHTNTFSYFTKIEWLRKAVQRIPSNLETTKINQTVLEMALTALRIERNTGIERPLLSKINYDLCRALWNPTTGDTDPQILQFVQIYYDSIFANFTTEKRTKHQVYYLNFLQQLQKDFPNLTTKSSDIFINPVTVNWINTNDEEILEAAFMQAYFAEKNVALIAESILKSPNNTAPVKSKFLGFLWSESLAEIVTEDMKIALIPLITSQDWSLDLIYNWLERAFINMSKEESLILDAWVQQLKIVPRNARVTQFYFRNEWERLQTERSQNLPQEPNTQLRYSVLESLFSIKTE
jgi:hypothetical protein